MSDALERRFNKDFLTAARGLSPSSPAAWAVATTTRPGSTSSRTGPPPSSTTGGASSPAPWPGRTDLLDALRSRLVKDDTGLSGNLGTAVRTVVAARALGAVPPAAASPPLVARVRRGAESLRLNLGDRDTRIRASAAQWPASPADPAAGRGYRRGAAQDGGRFLECTKASPHGD